MNVLGCVPVHVDANTKIEVCEGETSTWLVVGKGEVYIAAQTPEAADYLALKVTALANRMRERKASVPRPFDLAAEMERIG